VADNYIIVLYFRYHRGTRGKDKYTPVFGVNCSLIQEGVVSVGDLISVTY